jgi:hypothetical protein
MWHPRRHATIATRQRTPRNPNRHPTSNRQSSRITKDQSPRQHHSIRTSRLSVDAITNQIAVSTRPAAAQTARLTSAKHARHTWHRSTSQGRPSCEQQDQATGDFRAQPSSATRESAPHRCTHGRSSGRSPVPTPVPCDLHPHGPGISKLAKHQAQPKADWHEAR